jgi:membrane associated rhomboid family serine protease
MRSAAVGFQCPSCVKDGAKQTRQASLPYGGQRVADPRLTTYALIGLNALVWLIILATGGSNSRLLDKLALLPDSAFTRYSDGSVVLVRGVADGAWWQPMTSVFTHVEALHIGFNMLALFFLGPILENVLGRSRFLAVYLVSALAGSAAVMLFADPHSQTIGASGAIFGLMGALAVMALKVRGQVQTVLMWIALNLVFTFTASGISWQGHIGGLVGGAVIGAAMVYAPRNNRSVVQWGVTGLVLAISVVLIAAKAVALS